mmetsp:Transcript_35143/g.48922  ORF Transcript_35143/g.48922 Transcript_35143/m.48922 type:complete len:157 (+) Transcript_35143:614-1084(+)
MISLKFTRTFTKNLIRPPKTIIPSTTCQCVPCCFYYRREYGDPPSPTAFFAQLGVYMLLTVMIKGILFSTEVLLRPYLDIWGYVMFSQYDSFPKLKLVFVMIVTPFVLNSIQFWIIDSLLKGKSINDEKERNEHIQEDTQCSVDTIFTKSTEAMVA